MTSSKPQQCTLQRMASLPWGHCRWRMFCAVRFSVATSWIKPKSYKKIEFRSYFMLSLMDNFDWADGFKVHFTMFHIDFSDAKFTQII